MPESRAKMRNASKFIRIKPAPTGVSPLPHCIASLNELIKSMGSNSSVICVIPVDDTTPCSQVLSPHQPPIQGVVLHEGGLAVRGGVNVPVVTN